MKRCISSINKIVRLNESIFFLAIPIISRISLTPDETALIWKKSELVFGVALSAAGLKDLLDILPATGVGYALVIIMTILIFIFIGFMILIGIFLGGGGGLHILLMLFGGTAIEILPGIDFLPLTMATVITIYWTILSKRKKTAAKIQANYA